MRGGGFASVRGGGGLPGPVWPRAAAAVGPFVSVWGALAGPDDLPQHFALPGGVVPVGLRDVGEAAFEADDGDGGVGEAGQVAGEASGADTQVVLVVGHVAEVMEAVLDLPVAAVQRGQFCRPAPGGGGRGRRRSAWWSSRCRRHAARA